MRQLTALEKRWQEAVKSLEWCAVCKATGPVQWSHRNEGKGMGVKVGPHLTAALCQSCHHEIDNGKNLTRDERRAQMDRAIVLTHDALIRDGRLALK